MIQRLLSRIGEPRSRLRAEFALERWLADCREAASGGLALDIGCGVGRHLARMKESGVFAERHGMDLRAQAPGVGEAFYHSGFLEDFHTERQYDAIWCSHVLEHTQTPGTFLAQVRALLREGGVLGLIVPPLKRDVTVGHVNLYTPGVLMLNLLKAGFDCREIRLRRKGYNIAAILRHRPCAGCETFAPDAPGSCRPFLPEGLCWRQGRGGVWYFDGDIVRLNWP